LSISPDGELIVLVRGDVKPQVYAWSRDGALEWDGILPFQTRFGRMAGTDLLLLDHHIVRLVTASDLR
ncbi:MAG: hypothetical protein QGH59_06500, partial [Gemmatimonadota bacterium]|nr:hypothetical protein [Gemmatimonadota bacterium]